MPHRLESQSKEGNVIGRTTDNHNPHREFITPDNVVMSFIDHQLAKIAKLLLVREPDGRNGPSGDKERWKNIIRSLYGRYPDLRNSVEDVITEGDKTLVRIRLLDGVNEVTNYMALHRVKGGQVVERWAFGDRNFERWAPGDRTGLRGSPR
jgi:hypothetical protein